MPVREIYFDNNATTAPDERVVQAMLPWLREGYGNPSSLHRPGEAAAGALSAARTAVARLVGATSPREIVFTSGGTEANNTALHTTLARAREQGRPGVLTSTIEHAGLLRPLEAHAARDGFFEVESVGVDARGAIDTARLLERIGARGSTVGLVSVMWANNEIGVVLPDDELSAIAAACRTHGIPFHVDAVQAPGKLPMDVAGLGIDLASLSAHKFHGPQGVGALYVRGGYEEEFGLTPLIAGGAQERNRRAGTQNVPGIAGLGRAAELARERIADPEAIPRLCARRDRLEVGLLGAVPGASVVAADAPRLPNTTSVRFPDLDGELLLQSLAAEGLAVSAGAACSAERRGASHVLRALGLSEAEASSCLRFSLSGHSTDDEVDAAVALVSALVGPLRDLGPARG